MLASMTNVIKKYPETALLVTGGEMSDDVKKSIKKHAIERNVEWLGYVDYAKMPLIFNAADVFVLPSFLEGQEGAPVALIEASTCETPVVVTNIAGNPNIIKNFKSGLIIPPKDSNAISEAILKILENPDMFKVNRENARKYYDWDYIIERYLRVYDRLFSMYYGDYK